MRGEDLRIHHDGLSFQCRLDGRTGAPWLVFSNSLLTDLSVWDDQVAELEEHFSILRYDQRGHGRTDVPDKAADFDQLGGDLIAILDHLGIETCSYVGLSMGVTTGLHLMRHRPDSVSRLVLCDGLAATAPGGAQAWEERIAGARDTGMETLARATVDRWFSEAFRAEGRHEKALDVAASTPLEGFVACARALQNYDYRDVLPGISIPVLVMAGDNDGAIPAAMEKMAAAIPDARMERIPDAGHIPNVEQPQIFNRHLKEFLL